MVTSDKNVGVPTVDVLHRLEKVLNSVQLDVTVSKPERAHNDATVAPKSCRNTPTISLKITAKPTPWEREQIAAQGHDPIDTMHLTVDDAGTTVVVSPSGGVVRARATEVARSRFSSAVDRQSSALRAAPRRCA